MNEENGSGTLTRRYIGRTMAQVDGAAWTYFAHDHLSSPRMMTDASKNVTGRQEYTPYGDIYASVSPGTTRGYTGHDFDAVSGLYFAPFRYYAPGLGRWLTPDPLGMVDGPNMYGYVGGNPIMGADPMGLCREAGQGYFECLRGEAGNNYNNVRAGIANAVSTATGFIGYAVGGVVESAAVGFATGYAADVIMAAGAIDVPLAALTGFEAGFGGLAGAETVAIGYTGAATLGASTLIGGVATAAYGLTKLLVEPLTTASVECAFPCTF